MAKTSDSGAAKRKTPISDNRVDSTLAAMIVGIIILSVISMIFYMIGTSGGWMTGMFAAMVWVLPFVGLPIAIILMLTVLIRVAVRRSRANKSQS